MTAGRGIVHCEMPADDDISHGLQLWVNLKAEDKMVEPQYQELKDKDIPRTKQDGVCVKVIAGETMGIKVLVSAVVRSLLLCHIYCCHRSGCSHKWHTLHRMSSIVFIKRATVAGAHAHTHDVP